jgi:hypothetical protein
MKLRHFVLFLLSVFLLLNVSSCCSAYDADEGQPPSKVTPNTQNPESFYTVLADEHLSEGHKTAILLSLNEWSEKTGNTFTYQLFFKDMTKEVADTATPHTIKIYVRDPGPGYAGWTSWSSGNRSAFTFVRETTDDELLRKVMLHELGHAFNLDFNGNAHYMGPYASVMYPSIGQAAPHLGCPDLEAFCREYKCQVECVNISALTSEEEPNPQWGETHL